MLLKVNLCVVIACMIQVNHAFYLRKKIVENVTLTEEVLLVGNCGDDIGRCGGSLCCSQYGWCGNTLSYCGEGCQGSFGNCYAVPTLSPTISLAPTVAPGSCGEGVGMCDSGLCCSKFGWCGSSSNYCGLGCQTNYGSCYTVNYNETMPLSYPTSIPSFSPSFQPSAEPQSLPISAPSIFPTVLLQVQLSPTLSPSTVDPTQYPSTNPTFSIPLPSLLLSVDPTLSPSTNPSFIPSELPSLPPTINPTDSNPTQLPTGTPFSQSSSSTSDNILSSIAGWTYYYAWPSGVFAGIGTRTLSFIETNNLIAFYDRSDPNGDFYYAKYANKYISLTATCQGNTYQFQALIADTCSGQPCNTNSNSETGYLVDMEYYTVMNIFGTTDCVSGNVQFSIDLSQSLVLPNCGGMIGACGGDQCCAANNYCGYSLSYCGEGCQNTYGPCLTSVAATSPPCGEGIGSCATVGDCCSQYGYCGSNDFYCSIGCQSNYGNCY